MEYVTIQQTKFSHISDAFCENYTYLKIPLKLKCKWDFNKYVMAFPGMRGCACLYVCNGIPRNCEGVLAYTKLSSCVFYCFYSCKNSPCSSLSDGLSIYIILICAIEHIDIYYRYANTRFTNLWLDRLAVAYINLWSPTFRLMYIITGVTCTFWNYFLLRIAHLIVINYIL